RGNSLQELQVAVDPEAVERGLIRPETVRGMVSWVVRGARLRDYQARKLAYDLELEGDAFRNGTRFFTTLAQTFVDLDAERLADEIGLNVGGLTRLSHAALAAMVPRRRGWLLNVSSIAGFQPAPRLAVYAATKAYVTSLTESLHQEVAYAGVHVTALCPGLTRTEFQSVSNTTSYVDRFPAFAWTSPDLVARTGLEAVIANRAIAVPGPQYRMLTGVANVTPRWIRRRVSSLVQRS
ncbi:MAG: SDR family NAD(P)-dependent oxidoreductase, partial [Ilumatobacteraceae bacterium]